MPLLDAIAGGVINTGLGLMLEGHNDQRQIKQQQKLQDMQIQGQEHMTDYNMGKQYEMWQKTNYGPQMEQLNKAGLNPGLLYGMSGGGATTIGNASGNVTGAQAPAGGREILDANAMGMQLEILRAQKQNIEADTANKIAQNPNIPLAGKNLQADTTGKELDNALKNSTLQPSIEKAILQVEQEMERLGILKTQNIKDANTRLDEQLLIANQALKTGFESTGADIHNEMQREQINAIKQEILNGIQKVQQGWKGLDIDAKMQSLNQWKAEMDKVFQGNTWYERLANKILDRIGGSSTTTTTPAGRTQHNTMNY